MAMPTFADAATVKRYGARVLQVRKALHLTRPQLAPMLGCSCATLALLENFLLFPGDLDRGLCQRIDRLYAELEASGAL